MNVFFDFWEGIICILAPFAIAVLAFIFLWKNKDSKSHFIFRTFYFLSVIGWGYFWMLFFFPEIFLKIPDSPIISMNAALTLFFLALILIFGLVILKAKKEKNFALKAACAISLLASGVLIIYFSAITLVFRDTHQESSKSDSNNIFTSLFII